MTGETFVCAVCGGEYDLDQRREFDDQDLCPDCLEQETETCSICGERIWSDNNAGDSDTPLCQSCYERLYTNCTRCGALIPNARVFYAWDDVGNEEPLCRDCYSHSTRPKAIQDYYYKPDPIFYGKGPRYFGVELEIDGAGECSENAQEILDLANGERELVYCKHDGSLNDGFEIVTHPMALKFHQKNMPWREILREAVSMGYRSHQAGTCGLHVHVSRAAFGKTYQEQDSAIARVLYFFEKHWEELLKFSRRTPRQLEHWAARYGYKEHPKDILDHAKKGTNGSRYTCVNLQNDSTIEFRIFRGTLKYNTLIATLQLVERICDVAIFLSDEELKAMSWTTFVSGCQAPELVQYLKERRLYVNEPVAGEEEL